MDVDLIFKIAAIGIIVAVLNQLLIRSGREDQAMMTTIAGLIVVLVMIIYEIKDLFDTIKNVFGLWWRDLDIFSIIGIAIISTALCILIKQYKPEYAMIVSLACGILLFSIIIVSLLPAFKTMSDLMQKAHINTTYTKAIIKTLGVCYVTQLASESCKDAGQSAIASKVELSGKVFIVLISLPLFEDLINIAFSLINTNV